MKKILLLLSLFFGVILNAQPFKVDFHVNRDGIFTRTDSEQQYYVFNVDSSYTAEKIKERFFNKILEMSKLPQYFEDDLPLSCYLNDKTGIISVWAPDIRLRRNDREKTPYTLQLFGKFKVQFKDGRFRIDPPDLVPSIDGGDRKMKEWLVTNMSPGASTSKFADVITNAMISCILEYVWKEPEEWPLPIEYKGEDNYHFSLADNCKFQFPDGKDYIVFSAPGVSQETLYSAFSKLLTQMKIDEYYDYFDQELRDHEVCLRGYQNIIVKSSFLNLPMKFRYDYLMLFEFKDEKIKVYVPRIYNVYYDSETVGNDIDYLNFSSYLVANKIYTSDGKPAKTNQRNKFDNAVTAKFNRLVLEPIRVFFEALEESKKPEEEW